MPSAMTPSTYRFDCFALDVKNRQLRRDNVPVDVNARYLDALVLLVRRRGMLISKEQFLDEVWGGIPVTDEALTQCIKTLRRQLGDDASQPRFIETVVKHGYRFIGEIESPELDETPEDQGPAVHGDMIRPGLAGAVGGGVAGALGGIFYGFAAASQPTAAETGSVSALIVVACLTFVMALLGGIGVSFGSAAARIWAGARSAWVVAGGAAGGFLIGAIVKFLGMDAFVLLFGHSPGNITGAVEGLCIGTAVGLSLWLDARINRRGTWRLRVAIAAVAGAGGGLLAVLTGGRLMGGSLLSLAQHFPGSHLRLDALGGLVGETTFGPLSQMVTAGIEGTLFSVCVVAAMSFYQRRRAL